MGGLGGENGKSRFYPPRGTSGGGPNPRSPRPSTFMAGSAPLL